MRMYGGRGLFSKGGNEVNLGMTADRGRVGHTSVRVLVSTKGLPL